MDFKTVLTIVISMVFINNFILSKFLGLCPFLGVSRNTKPAGKLILATRTEVSPPQLSDPLPKLFLGSAHSRVPAASRPTRPCPTEVSPGRHGCVSRVPIGSLATTAFSSQVPG